MFIKHYIDFDGTLIPNYNYTDGWYGTLKVYWKTITSKSIIPASIINNIPNKIDILTARPLSSIYILKLWCWINHIRINQIVCVGGKYYSPNLNMMQLVQRKIEYINNDINNIKLCINSGNVYPHYIDNDEYINSVFDSNKIFASTVKEIYSEK